LGPALESYIAQRREPILDQVARARGEGVRAAAGRMLSGWAFAAGLYRATLGPELEATALERLAAIVADLVAADEPGAERPRAAAA
jgi:hypothetical protein